MPELDPGGLHTHGAFPAALSLWLHAIVVYHEVLTELQPKMAQLKQMEAALHAANEAFSREVDELTKPTKHSTVGSRS